VGSADRHRDHPPAGTHTQLTSAKPSPAPQKGTLRAPGTPPTRRDSRAIRLISTRNTIPVGALRPANEDHERFRLASAQPRSTARSRRGLSPRPGLLPARNQRCENARIDNSARLTAVISPSRKECLIGDRRARPPRGLPALPAPAHQLGGKANRVLLQISGTPLPDAVHESPRRSYLTRALLTCDTAWAAGQRADHPLMAAMRDITPPDIC
jgi:hypothetical protein